MATSEDIQLAIREDFYMATDTRIGLRVTIAHGGRSPIGAHLSIGVDHGHTVPR